MQHTVVLLTERSRFYCSVKSFYAFLHVTITFSVTQQFLPVMLSNTGPKISCHSILYEFLNHRSVNQHPKVDQRDGQLCLPHVGIT